MQSNASNPSPSLPRLLSIAALQGEVVVDEAFAAKAVKASGLEAGGSPLILLDG
jgi:hypothetical protein